MYLHKEKLKDVNYMVHCHCCRQCISSADRLLSQLHFLSKQHGWSAVLLDVVAYAAHSIFAAGMLVVAVSARGLARLWPLLHSVNRINLTLT